MRLQQHLVWLAVMAMALGSAGCCCVQGTGPCGGLCGPVSCESGACGGGPIGRLASCSSCSGGCGETYVDEWVSEPPCMDQCCAGNCRPVRSLLQALWGCRYSGCDAGCEGGCSSGCDSCGYTSAGGSGCTTCGGSYGEATASGGCNCGSGLAASGPTPMPLASRHGNGHVNENQLAPSQSVSGPRRVKANVASQRINPAMQKMDARRASFSH